MAVFIISLRLGGDPGAASRRYSLLRSLHRVQIRFWDRLDHTMVFETSHTLSFLGDLFRDEIDVKSDLILLVQIGGGSIVCGENSDADIVQLLPDCRALV